MRRALQSRGNLVFHFQPGFHEFKLQLFYHGQDGLIPECIQVVEPPGHYPRFPTDVILSWIVFACSASLSTHKDVSEGSFSAKDKKSSIFFVLNELRLALHLQRQFGSQR